MGRGWFCCSRALGRRFGSVRALPSLIFVVGAVGAKCCVVGRQERIEVEKGLEGL